MTRRAEEVAWGESQETRVLARWLRIKQGASMATGWRVLKSRRYQDWDFLVLDSGGLPYAYVEIKVRRTSFSTFGDAIAPVRKHELARKLHVKHGIDFLMVVEYPDALVEVDLAVHPDKVGPVQRTDRPGGPVAHAFWARDQIQVLT